VLRQRRADEHLAHDRHDLRRAWPWHVLVDRNVAPADERLAFLGDDALHERLHSGAPRVVGREEAHADAVATLLGQLEVDDAAEELVGDLEEDARTVARVDLRPDGAAVLEAEEDIQRTLDDLVLAAVVEARHRSDATSIVFETWVVEARGHGSLQIEHMKVGVGSKHPGRETRPAAASGREKESRL
jgi:hypothetical protein